MKTMPIMKVLPDAEGESNDTPKLFTNIDEKEEFKFTWVGDATFINKGKDSNGQDIFEKKIEKTDYVVKSGETRTFPKYLVNYAATHLTKKIMKREAFEAEPDEKIRKMGLVKWDNEERAKELSAKMVAKNYENKKEEIKEETGTEDNPLKCQKCGFIAKSKFGLNSHTRLKHK